MDNSIIPVIRELEQKCTKCKMIKSVNNFYIGNNKNNRRWICKLCDANHNKEYCKNYYLKNIISFKNYYQNNKKKINKYKRIQCKLNINCRIYNNLRARLNGSLRGNPKLETTMKLVGCSIDQLKKHLQNKFIKGMSWSNYGKWHIDHIRPCASFDLSKSSEQRKCFNYTNLQPLWAKDNLRKSDNFWVKE